MRKNRSRFVPGVTFQDEILEPRVVLSGGGAAAEVSAFSMKKAPTRTSLGVISGTLGLPITFTISVRGSASAGSPLGTVKILDRGQVIGTATLTPTANSGRFATSSAVYTILPVPGGTPYAQGRHRVTAVYVPSAGFAKSTAARTFAVSPPAYTALADGVKIATIRPGAGPAIALGQTANVLYTGYLAKTGKIFDASSFHGNAPLSFRVGAGQVIPGFDAGTAGMRVGETRAIFIPPSQGYGSTANGPIPANSTLIFLVTLRSIG